MRTATIRARCTPREKEIIEAAADHAGQTVSEYLLRACGIRGNGLGERPVTIISGTGSPVAVLSPQTPRKPPPPKPAPAPPSTSKRRVTCDSRVPVGSFCKKCGEVHQ